MYSMDANGQRATGRQSAPMAEREAVFEDLFRTHYADLRTYGLKISGQEPLVEDAIQDVFLALWEGDTRLSDITHPKGYLLTALRRRVLAWKAAQRSRRQRDQRHAAHFLPFAISREELLIDAELEAAQRAQLAKALCELSDRRKEALYLRFYHGLTYEEVAGVMGIRNQTARNYVFEALQFLRAQSSLQPVATLRSTASR